MLHNDKQKEHASRGDASGIELKMSPENLKLAKVHQNLTAVIEVWDLLWGKLANNETLNSLLLLSSSDLKRTARVIYDLREQKLLDSAALSKVFKEITGKYNIARSTVVKKSRKETGEARSQFIVDDKIEFYIQHNHEKEYDGGGFGKVKRAYAASKGGPSLFAIKTLLTHNEEHAFHEAQREVRSHRILGRKAFYFFRNKKTYIGSEWQSGTNLNQYLAHELRSEPYSKRILWLVSGLTSLDMLHQSYRVHGDIKPLNFILDTDSAVLRLIDFGTTRKRDTQGSFPYTEAYLPPDSPKNLYDFSYDIYSMGLVIAFIFPELFIIKDVDGKKSASLIKKSDIMPFEKGIQELVKAMEHPNNQQRCSAGEALNYCRALADKMDDLDLPWLMKILETTINRATSSLDDVIHGVLRKR